MENRYTSNLAVDLGRTPYLEALRIQKDLVELIRKSDLRRILLFLEHDPVYTTGRKSSKENFQSVDVVETERGGDVTYHGPGQLVVYPIFRLSTSGNVDVRSYVKSIEDITIKALRSLGFDTHVGEEPGIWIHEQDGEKKVASIGMAIDHGISYHGIAINHSPEVLPWFSRIRPCGMEPGVMGYADTDEEALKHALLRSFSDAYGPFETIDRTSLMTMILDDSVTD